MIIIKRVLFLIIISAFFIVVHYFQLVFNYVCAFFLFFQKNFFFLSKQHFYCLDINNLLFFLKEKNCSKYLINTFYENTIKCIKKVKQNLFTLFVNTLNILLSYSLTLYHENLGFSIGNLLS